MKTSLKLVGRFHKMEKIPGQPFINWVNNRIKRNKNALIVVNGATGSGKSYSCISLAQDVAKRTKTHFSLEGNVAFSFTELLEKMKLPKNQKPGTAFVFEEVGAFGGGASSREWQSKSNKFFFSFMQTSRHRNQVIFMNCPNFSFLESGARSLVHFQLEAQAVDVEKQVCIMNPYRIQVNSRSGKFYFKFLRIFWKGRTYKLKKLEVLHPGKAIAEEYEVMKTNYTSQLNDKMLEEEKPVGKIKKNQEKVPLNVLANLMEKGYTNTQMAEIFDVSTKTISRSRKLLRGQGNVFNN